VGEVLVEGRRLDIKDGLDFSFNYSIADVRDPNKRSTEYSKTIVCPSTPSNDELFGNIWDVNISNHNDPVLTNIETNFNPNKKAEARVVSDGVEVMVGVVQLRQIVILDGKIDYEVAFIGNLINIFSKLGDKNLNDFDVVDGEREYYIDFSDLNHTYSYANILGSWDNSHGYVYPMVDCGERTEYQQDGRRVWYTEDWRPWLKVKTVIDRIFAYAGFTYTSDFFDSTMFGRLITSEIKETILSEDELAERNAKASIGTTYDILDAANLVTSPVGNWNRLKLDTVIYDEGANWQTATFEYLAVNQLIANVSSTVTYSLTRDRQSYYSWTSASFPYRYDILANGNCDIYNYHTGALINTNQSTASPLTTLTGDAQAAYVLGSDVNAPLQDIIDTLTSDASERDLAFTANGQFFVGWDLMYGTIQPNFNQKLSLDNTIQGISVLNEVPFKFNTQVDIGDTDTSMISYVTAEEVSIFVTDKVWSDVFIPYSILDGVNSDHVNISGTATASDILWNELNNEYTLDPSGTMEVLAQNNGLIEWQTMDMRAIIPDVKMSEFLLSIFKMFNLYVTVDPINENNLLIETRNDFYLNGTIRDWTKKLARDKNVKIKPLGLLTAKEFIYSYKEDKDYYNEKYQDSIGYTYGRRRIETDNDFLNNTQNIEVVFSPTPLINDNPSNRLIPKIYDSDDDEGIKPTEANIRILYYAGLITSAPSWDFKHKPLPPFNLPGSYFTNTFWEYPYAGHLDHPLTPSLDLNFGIPQKLFYTANAFTGTLQYTNANLFKVYHQAYLDEITDKDSKVLTGEFYLTAWDIAKLDFRDQIIVDNAYWRINKINDYNPFKEGLTKVELIKALDVVQTKVEAFTIGGEGQTGGGSSSGSSSSEPYPATGRKAMRGANITHARQGSVKGRNNRIADSADAYKVIGDNNFIGQGTRNINILGSDNYVASGLENVSIINSDNQEVTESNTTIIDGKKTWHYVDATTTYTTSDREFVLADATSGAFTVTLPKPGVSTDVWINVKKVDSTANAITIDATGSITIDGSATQTLSTQYDSVDFYCDGSNWHIR
jgi:hypothetical protein